MAFVFFFFRRNAASWELLNCASFTFRRNNKYTNFLGIDWSIRVIFIPDFELFDSTIKQWKRKKNSTYFTLVRDYYTRVGKRNQVFFVRNQYFVTVRGKIFSRDFKGIWKSFVGTLWDIEEKEHDLLSGRLWFTLSLRSYQIIFPHVATFFAYASTNRWKRVIYRAEFRLVWGNRGTFLFLQK